MKVWGAGGGRVGRVFGLQRIWLGGRWLRRRGRERRPRGRREGRGAGTKRTYFGERSKRHLELGAATYIYVRRSASDGEDAAGDAGDELADTPDGLSKAVTISVAQHRGLGLCGGLLWGVVWRRDARSRTSSFDGGPADSLIRNSNPTPRHCCQKNIWVIGQKHNSFLSTGMCTFRFCRKEQRHKETKEPKQNRKMEDGK